MCPLRLFSAGGRLLAVIACVDVVGGVAGGVWYRDRQSNMRRRMSVKMKEIIGINIDSMINR